MRYLAYNEPIQHRTGELPLAYYYVDERHPRYQMRMHWHREAELLLVRRGALRLYADDALIEAGAGDLTLLCAGALHGGDPEDCVYECVVFEPYALLPHVDVCVSALKPLLSRTAYLKRADRVPGLGAAIDRFYGYARGMAAGREAKLLGALCELLGLLSEQEGLVRVASTRAGVKADQLKPALEYIENNYGAHIALDELARLTGMSPKYFCRCFRAIVHRSPIDYLNHYRIECACHFLAASDMTVAEIAQQCGYNDSSFFIKQFRRYKGTTPRLYRKAGAASES